MGFFIFINLYAMPFLAAIFCLHFVAIWKKIKKDEPTAANTFWLTASFVLMVWSFAVTISYNVY